MCNRDYVSLSVLLCLRVFKCACVRPRVLSSMADYGGNTKTLQQNQFGKVYSHDEGINKKIDGVLAMSLPLRNDPNRSTAKTKLKTEETNNGSRPTPACLIN